MTVNVPLSVSILFIAITLLTLVVFVLATKCISALTSRKISIILITWLIIQGGLALNNIYSNLEYQLPPKLLMIGILPASLIVGFVMSTKNGKIFIDALPLKYITYLNTVRIPVEIGLYVLYLHHTVPQLMTFEGGNLDILSGISAPFIAYFGFNRGYLGRKTILAWNFICLALLLNIVIRALLSTPFPIQKLAFEQPNIAILYFPFVWLPTFIVPIILFGHLISIRRLWLNISPKGILSDS